MFIIINIIDRLSVVVSYLSLTSNLKITRSFKKSILGLSIFDDVEICPQGMRRFPTFENNIAQKSSSQGQTTFFCQFVWELFPLVTL